MMLHHPDVHHGRDQRGVAMAMGLTLAVLDVDVIVAAAMSRDTPASSGSYISRVSLRQ